MPLGLLEGIPKEKPALSIGHNDKFAIKLIYQGKDSPVFILLQVEYRTNWGEMFYGRRNCPLSFSDDIVNQRFLFA